MFMNIFFAIIDRNFVVAEPEPYNVKRKLRPLFGKCCWCIVWDEDYVMEADTNAQKQTGPPSRRIRVHRTQLEIQSIQENANENSMGSATRKSKRLDDVCDVDDK